MTSKKPHHEPEERPGHGTYARRHDRELPEQPIHLVARLLVLFCQPLDPPLLSVNGPDPGQEPLHVRLGKD